MRLKVINTGSKHGNCYALTAENGEILLLDFGCKYTDILKGINYRVSDVSGALLTHEHGDHMAAIKHLDSAGIDIYTGKGTFDFLKERVNVLPRILAGRKKVQIGSFAVTPFIVPHTTFRDGAILPCPCFGYVIQHSEMGRLVYMTDLEYCPLKFRQIHVEHLLCEVNYCESLVSEEAANHAHRIMGHMSFETFKDKVLRENMTPWLRTVTICHLSDTAADPALIRTETQAIVGKDTAVNIASPGLEIELTKMPF